MQAIDMKFMENFFTKLGVSEKDMMKNNAGELMSALEWRDYLLSQNIVKAMQKTEEEFCNLTIYNEDVFEEINSAIGFDLLFNRGFRGVGCKVFAGKDDVYIGVLLIKEQELWVSMTKNDFHQLHCLTLEFLDKGSDAVTVAFIDFIAKKARITVTFDN